MSQVVVGGPLISVGDASRLLASDSAIALDATYFAASEGADALDVYRLGHLPQARRFDIEAVSRPSCELPHMLPDGTAFEAMMGKLGIGSDQVIIIYDRPRLRSAPRVWWTLRYFGHQQVFVLDGGYATWIAAGLPSEKGDRDFPQATFRASVHADLVANLDDVIEAARNGSAQILDARPAGRFNGTEGDSWTPRRGHIRGSKSIPSSTLLNSEGALKTETELRALFGPVLDGRPIIATCGSGIAASVLALALTVIGRNDVAVFDGSWAEWGQSQKTLALTIGSDGVGSETRSEGAAR